MNKVAITGFVRTAVGAYIGRLKTVPVEELGAIVVHHALRRSALDGANIPIDGVIMGHVISSTDCPNLGRTVALLNDLTDTPGMTVNRICGSGLQAIASAAQEIRTGHADIMVAGGAESLSRIPYYLPLPARYEGFYRGNATLKCADINCQLNASPQPMYSDINHMGVTAEVVAQRMNISREDQDLYAYNSQMRCKAAMERGRFNREIVPVQVKSKKAVTVFDKDEHPRPDTTMESLAAMKPVFRKGGTVTVGNSSGANDGAGAMVLMSEEKCRELGIKPMAYLVDHAIAACDPRVMGLGPAYAIPKLLKRNGLELDQMDVIEINEAFAAQMLGCMKMLDIYLDSPIYQDRINPNGSGISLGHPLGLTGLRITGTAVYELIERQGRYAVSSACIGGGQGIALLMERV